MKTTIKFLFLVFLLGFMSFCFIKGRKVEVIKKVPVKDTSCIIENKDSIGRIWLDSTHIRVMFKAWYSKNYIRNLKESNL